MTDWHLSDFLCLRRKYLVYNLVSRNLKVKYRFSIFGFLWTLLVPLSSALIYYLVFSLIMKVRIDNYLVYILSGVLPWNFFMQTVMEGMDSLISNTPILSKVPVPVQTFPLSGALTNLVSLVLSFPVILGAIWFSNVPLTLHLLWLPLLLGCLFFIAYSFAVIFSLGFVYFRDLKHICGVIMQIWFYATPVIYLESMIPQNLVWLLKLNPVGHVFKAIHLVCFNGQSPELGDFLVIATWVLLTVTAAVTVLRLGSQRVVECL
jgi:lipopolysaccharide transport system permease protein